MRVVIYSDVHAIPQAMSAFEQTLRGLQPDAVWFLGDLVGRGHAPYRVVATARNILNRYSGVVLLGNHDMSALGRLPDLLLNVNGAQLSDSGFPLEQIKQDRAHAAEIQERSPELWEWLNTLQYRAMPLPGYLLAHGYFAPDDDMRTVWHYATRNGGLRLEQLRQAREGSPVPPRLIALGHYHIAGLWQWQENELCEFDIWAQEWVELHNLTAQPVILNAGTLSLPRREGDHGNYVVLDIADDLDSVRVGFRHLRFDWRPLIDVFCDGYLNADHMRMTIQRNLLPSDVSRGGGLT
jgi:predicted phosphodiesterase